MLSISPSPNLQNDTLVGGRKLWVGLLLSEHCGACRLLCTSVSIWNHHLNHSWNYLHSSHVWGNGSLMWGVSQVIFGYRVAIYLVAVPNSFHHFWEVYDIERGINFLSTSTIMGDAANSAQSLIRFEKCMTYHHSSIVHWLEEGPLTYE